MDAYAYQNDELLVFVAAGNSGANDASQTVGEPATAKNIISVGASQSFGSDKTKDMKGPAYMAGFSSRGPTLDGRTKPEIIAPGQWIVSAAARTNEVGECDPDDDKPPGPGEAKSGLISMEGTSISTPIAAGAAALVRQYLREGFYPSGERNRKDSVPNPSAALIKAILLNGGQDMRGVDNGNGKVTELESYDNTQNFGRISLMDSLYIRHKSNVHLKIWDRMTLEGNNADSFNIVSVHLNEDFKCYHLNLMNQMFRYERISICLQDAIQQPSQQH